MAKLLLLCEGATILFILMERSKYGQIGTRMVPNKTSLYLGIEDASGADSWTDRQISPSCVDRSRNPLPRRLLSRDTDWSRSGPLGDNPCPYLSLFASLSVTIYFWKIVITSPHYSGRLIVTSHRVHGDPYCRTEDASGTDSWTDRSVSHR